jgi:hypothetical protein
MTRPCGGTNELRVESPILDDVTGFCSTCGRPLSDDFAFCPHCGSGTNPTATPPVGPIASARSGTPPSPTASPAIRSGIRILPRVFVPIAVVVIAFTGYVVLTTHDLTALLLGVLIVVLLYFLLGFIPSLLQGASPKGPR